MWMVYHKYTNFGLDRTIVKGTADKILFQVKTVQNRLNYTKMCFSCQSLNYCLKANNFSINKIMIQQ